MTNKLNNKNYCSRKLTLRLVIEEKIVYHRAEYFVREIETDFV